MNLTTEQDLLQVSGQMAARLRLWATMRRQAEERGETTVELHPAELFEEKDREALAAWDDFVKRRAGEVPLFQEGVA